jgi:two-component system, cell cycle response regulator DivK
VAKKTILIIEDNPGDRAIYGNMLWYNGFDVVFAEDGETGFDIARQQRPDLILLDLQLPLLHGSEVMSQLKQDDDTKEIPVVALTARRLSEFGGNARVLGYAKFLEKPISPLEVLRVIEQLIGRAVVDQAQKDDRPDLRARQEDEVRRAVPVGGIASAEVQAIASDVTENANAVLEEWEDLVREEPWFSLPREDRLGFLAEVITSLADASLVSPGELESCRKTVVAAAAHGRSRRTQNIPESVLPIEFHLLRRAVWRYMTQKFTPSEDLHGAILAIDGAISLALNACMWGYFRDEIEAQGMWETAVDRLVESACRDIAQTTERATE